MTPWYMPIVWGVMAVYAAVGALLFILAWRGRRAPRKRR